MTPFMEKQLHEALVLACPELMVHEECVCGHQMNYVGTEGRPIRLSHMLRAIEKKIETQWLDGKFPSETIGNFQPYLWEKARECIQKYNLTKDSLSEQSPEFKSWLHSILCAA